jgi:hypothetical protein
MVLTRFASQHGSVAPTLLLALSYEGSVRSSVLANPRCSDMSVGPTRNLAPATQIRYALAREALI